MSGPKGASYTLSPAERARMALAAARVRQAAAERRVAAARSHLAGSDITLPRSPVPSLTQDAAQVDSFVAELIAHAEQLEGIVLERRMRSVTTHLSASLADLTVDIPLREAPPTTTQSTPGDGTAKLVARVVDLDQALARLPDKVAAPLVERLARATALIEKTDAVRAAQAVESLRAEVAQAQRTETRRLAVGRRKSGLTVAYADVPGDAQNAWRTLTEATTDSDLARARALLDQARETARRRTEQQFVLHQAQAALEDLGYRVEKVPGDTADTLLAQKTGWSHHGLRMLFPQGQRAFSSTPEAYGDTDQRDDVAFETESCQDIDAVLARLASRGIVVSTHVAIQAGQHPIHRPTSTQVRGHVAHPRERSL